MKGRKGFGYFWDGIDSDIQNNIEEEIEDIVCENIRSFNNDSMFEDVLVESMNHPTDWSEFRKTLMFFAMLNNDNADVIQSFISANKQTETVSDIDFSHIEEMVKSYNDKHIND